MPEQHHKPLRHGSTIIVYSPDTKHSRNHHDFGKGFYTTNNERMAVEWARTKMEKRNTLEGVVNIYEAPVIPADFKVKKFTRMDEEWLDFIYKNRNLIGYSHGYDIVIGPTADLDINTIVRDYEFALKWNDDPDKIQKIKQETLKLLRSKQVGTQISFHTERATSLLRFLRYKPVISNTPPPPQKGIKYGPKR